MTFVLSLFSFPGSHSFIYVCVNAGTALDVTGIWLSSSLVGDKFDA